MRYSGRSIRSAAVAAMSCFGSGVDGQPRARDFQWEEPGPRWRELARESAECRFQRGFLGWDTSITFLNLIFTVFRGSGEARALASLALLVSSLDSAPSVTVLQSL
jgi:hypothetical protein